MPENNLASLYLFYGWWQVTVGLFSAMALWAVWQHITKDQTKENKDLGLVWLSMAILVWSISGVVEIFYANALFVEAEILKSNINHKSEINKSTFESLRSILSMANSALILLALPCFKHIPKYISKYVKSDAWRFLVLSIFGFGALVNLLMFTEFIIPQKIAFINTIDFAFAIFTLIFLGMVLWSSFEKRGIKTLAYLSALCIICTLIAQALKLVSPDLWGSEFWRIFFSCTFKTILIMLFFALALSWIEELSKTFLPRPKDMHLVFIKKKNASRKFEYHTIITVPPSIQTHKIKFTEKPFELFLKFAQKSKTATSPENTWLEIQPKSGKVGDYDIKDYNQINRILDPILNQVKGQNNWSSDEDRKALKNALFDYQNRKVRLRVDQENITLAEDK